MEARSLTSTASGSQSSQRSRVVELALVLGTDFVGNLASGLRDLGLRDLGFRV